MANGVLQRLRAWLWGCPLPVRRWACGIQAALIAVLSLLPAWLFPPSPVSVPGLDKIVHAGLYGLLGALLRWAAAAGGRGAGVHLGWPLAAAGYGLLMEFLQLAFGGGTRMFSWGDALANLAGAMGLWIAAGRFLGPAPPRES